MKFRKNKKGFTIVELIIVIAVIGILTAVMVPTIVHLVNKANKASDEALVSNLNKAIQLRRAEPGVKAPATMHETVVGLEEYGYKLDALVAKSDQDLLYDLKADKFLLAGDAVEEKKADYWKIQKDAEEQKYNIYASKGFEFKTKTDLTVGFDAGNEAISSVSFKTDDVKDVVIRTNGGNFTVDALESSVHHFGNVNELEVKAVKKNHSYHEFGVVAVKATLISGTIDVETDGYIKEVDTTDADATSTLSVNGYVSKVTVGGNNVKASSGTGYVADNDGEPMGSPSALETKIETVADLQKFKAKVNDGYDYSLLTVKLAADLDISNLAWEPIGNKQYSFVGTFDGQNHTIKGLSNNGFEMDEYNIQPSTYSGNVGSSYGFFGVIGGTEGTITTIKNLSLVDVNINSRFAKNLGGLFGADAKAFGANSGMGSIRVENVTVKGSITSGNTSGVTIGGIGGKIYNQGRTDVVNCQNYANLTAVEATSGDVKGAGIVGFVSNESNNDSNTFVFDNCKNFGNADLKTTAEEKYVYFAGIVVKSWGKVYVKDSTTQGETTLEAPYGTVCYSPIARSQDHDVWTTSQESFEETTYDVYQSEYSVTKLYGSNCNISEDEGFASFKTTVVCDKYSTTEEIAYYYGTIRNREFTSADFDSHSLFYIFDTRPWMPYAPGHVNS